MDLWVILKYLCENLFFYRSYLSCGGKQVSTCIGKNLIKKPITLELFSQKITYIAVMKVIGIMNTLVG